MAPSPENARRAARDFAIVVGIARYPILGQDATPNNLAGPINDAMAMTDWLVNDVGVPCDNVFCITSEGRGTCRMMNGTRDETFPEDRIQQRPGFADLTARMEFFVTSADIMLGGPAGIGRRLWVYMAGHGIAPSTNTRDICILPANAHTIRNANPINVCVTKWLDYVAFSEAFDEVVLWLDCCADIGFGVTASGPDANVEKRNPPANRVYAAATKFAKIAYEAADPETGQVGGLFTRKLLGALRGRVAPESGTALTTRDLRGYFENPSGQIRAVVNGQEVTQTADFIEDADLEIWDVGHIPFDAPATEPHVDVYAVPAEWPAGTSLTLLDGGLNPVDEFIVDADGKVRISAPVGLYLFRGADGRKQMFELESKYLESS